MKKLIALVVLVISATPVSALENGTTALVFASESASMVRAESRALRAADNAQEFEQLNKNDSPMGMRVYRTNYAPGERHVLSLSAGLSDLSKKAEANINVSLTW